MRANVVKPTPFSRLTAKINDERFINFTCDNFTVDQVATFVLVFSHESIDVSGEISTVGGGRAARVAVSVSPGWASSTASPEDLRSHLTEIRSMEEAHSPLSAGDELRWAAEQLGLGDLDVFDLLEGRTRPDRPGR